MRGKISDQDLTDYALNELAPEERLYLESMLAVSEECRHDVYEMIEMGQMLEEGYEREDDAEVIPFLTAAQRTKVLHVKLGPPAWQRAVAVLGAAACAAFAIVHPGFWQVSNPDGRMAQVSTRVTDMMTNAVGSSQSGNFTTSIATLVGDTAEWIQAEMPMAQPAVVCTPPSLFEGDSAAMSAVIQ